MAEQEIVTDRASRVWNITFNQPKRRNVINGRVLQDIMRAFDEAEADTDCRVIVLQGTGGYFCTGMDFEGITRDDFSGTHESTTESSRKSESRFNYMDLLKRIASSPKVVISKVNGVALAGGIGIIAASDLVIATPESQFGLSEALWGLLPACVTPYLIRRVGFHWAYRMTLTTENLSVEQATEAKLVDVCTDTPDVAIRKYLIRLSRLSDETVLEIKRYFRQMWIINENMEGFAVSEINRLMNKPVVRENIANYVNRNQFPWS